MKYIIQTSYDVVREQLPKRPMVLNGIPANINRLLDTTVYNPDYKKGSISSLRGRVRDGDDVIVIGGGWGITPVVAAKNGDNVTVYEASAEYCDVVRETASINRVSDSINVIHAAVGPVFDGFGEGIDKDGIHPGSLPEADVIEIDAEGAEMDILDGMEIRPRLVIAEAHPEFGVEAEEIEQWMRSNGYDIVNWHDHDGHTTTTLTGVRDQ